MNTFDYEDALFRIDPNLKDFRDSKDAFIQFNNRNTGFPIKAREVLDKLIPMYQATEHDIFREFGELLKNMKITSSIHFLW